MHKIQKIGVMSMARLQGILFLAFGLIFGLIYGLVLAAIGLFTMSTGDREGIILVFVGLGFGIGFPILYGLMGFLMGALMSWLYNVVARKFGGVEIELTA